MMAEMNSQASARIARQRALVGKMPPIVTPEPIKMEIIDETRRAFAAFFKETVRSREIFYAWDTPKEQKRREPVAIAEPFGMGQGLIAAARPTPRPVSDEPVVKAPSHTHGVFDPKTLPGIVDRVVAKLDEIKPDAILVCGHSGLFLAGAVSARTGIPTIAVRKKDETAFATSSRVSCVLPRPARRWVWLDDLVASGRTLTHSVQEALACGALATPVPVAMVLYCRTDDDHDYTLRWSLKVDGIDNARCPVYGVQD